MSTFERYKYPFISLVFIALIGAVFRVLPVVDQPVSKQATHSGEEVRIPTAGGVLLAGTIFIAPDADMAVVLAHSFVQGQSQTGLHPLAQELARNGITALAFDFQGRGLTGDQQRYEQVHTDVKAAIDYLTGLGHERIGSLGVGLGGFGSAKNGLALSALVTISIPLVVSNRLGVDEADLSLPYPKLFISADQDFANRLPFAQYARDLYAMAAEPKQVKIYSGTYHSMDLFQSEHGPELNTLIIDFFTNLP